MSALSVIKILKNENLKKIKVYIKGRTNFCKVGLVGLFFAMKKKNQWPQREIEFQKKKTLISSCP